MWPMVNNYINNSNQKNIIPRINKKSRNFMQDIYESDSKAMKKIYNKNIGKIPLSNDEKITIKEIPDDFQKEISRFRIPNRQPQPIKKKRRKQAMPESVNIQMVEDEDERHSQEEEEEVEEKKEKVHKFTIKKKRPFVNTTKSLPQKGSYLSSYSTLVDSSGADVVGDSPPLHYHAAKVKPLILQENVDVLNPNHYDGGVDDIRKGVKTRDVNLIVRTRHSPRILIRRYKPLFGSYMGLNFVDRSRRPYRRPHRTRAKPCKKCKKKKKKNKFYHTNIKNNLPTSLASDVENVVHSHSHPNTNQPPPLLSSCDEFSLPLSHTHHAANNFATYSHRPLYNSQSFSSHHYSPNNNDYHYDENLISPRLPSQPINSYIRMPYESQNSPYEAYTIMPFAAYSTESPYTAKTEQVSAKEKMPHSYDVHEHENTEQLAANHQQEMDGTLEDDDNNILPYDSNDGDGDDNGVGDSGNEGENVVEDYDEQNEDQSESNS